MKHVTSYFWLLKLFDFGRDSHWSVSLFIYLPWFFNQIILVLAPEHSLIFFLLGPGITITLICLLFFLYYLEIHLIHTFEIQKNIKISIIFFAFFLTCSKLKLLWHISKSHKNDMIKIEYCLMQKYSCNDIVHCWNGLKWMIIRKCSLLNDKY